MRLKGNFADTSRVLPEGDEACVCVCVHVDGGGVRVY